MTAQIVDRGVSPPTVPGIRWRREAYIGTGSGKKVPATDLFVRLFDESSCKVNNVMAVATKLASSFWRILVRSYYTLWVGINSPHLHVNVGVSCDIWSRVRESGLIRFLCCVGPCCPKRNWELGPWRRSAASVVHHPAWRPGGQSSQSRSRKAWQRVQQSGFSDEPEAQPLVRDMGTYVT